MITKEDLIRTIELGSKTTYDKPVVIKFKGEIIKTDKNKQTWNKKGQAKNALHNIIKQGYYLLAKEKQVDQRFGIGLRDYEQILEELMEEKIVEIIDINEN